MFIRFCTLIINRFKTLFLVFLAIFLVAMSSYAGEGEEGFGQWLEGFKGELRKEGVSDAVINEAWPKMKYVSRVIELDRNQPEFKMSFRDYVKRVYDQKQINLARKLFHENREILTKIGDDFGVQPQYIVALWGVESRFGQLQGDFFVPTVLATLAYDGRRAAFFKKETINAFQILNKKHTTVDNFQGSWAGAMGQIQFMPSSYLAFAVDYDGDGKIDIWGSKADVFASAANYLKKSGWKRGEKWGREVSLKGSMHHGEGKCEKWRSMDEWQKLGVRDISYANLPKTDMRACLVIPDQNTGRAFLAYDNYQAIMKWNKSYYFATAVGLLADQIK